MTRLVFDTSAAVPLLLRSHVAHASVREYAHNRQPVLTAQSLAETYSVLTRLPGDARLSAADAVRLIVANFGPTLTPEPSVLVGLPSILAPMGIVGGAVFDALVALAAKANDVALVTRDARALGTYAAVGVVTEIVGQ